MKTSRDCRRWVSACVLSVGLGSCLLAPPAAVSAQDKEKPKPAEKKLAFEMRNKPWRDVFEWLSDVTEVPYIGFTPTGTFNFVPPAKRQYTLGEIIDIINESLLTTDNAPKFILIRRESSFTLIPANEKPDLSLIPFARLEELAARGQTEIVRVVIPMRTRPAADIAPEVKKLLGPFGEVVALSGQLVVQDTAGNVRRVLKTVESLETTPQGPPPATGDAPVLKNYPVPGGHAETLATMLQEVYKGSPAVRIVPFGRNGILVLAGSKHQLQIATLLRGGAAAPVTELISLSTLDAGRLANTLRTLLGDPKTGGPHVEVDPARNALIVRGSAEQVQEIKSVLRSLGEAGDKAGNTRVFTLESGGAATLAEALRHMLTQMRSNPVKVVVPARVTGDAARSEPPKQADPGKKDAKPGKSDVPILLAAVSNRLIVTTEDPQALALVEELVRLLQAPAVDGDFEVVRLKYAKAESVARILDEAFNGARPTRGGFQGGTAGMGPGPARPERVRVIADPATNSLLIKAGPLDVLTIRNLLMTALDTDAGDDRAVVRTWTLGPLKHAKAAQVAAAIKPLYRDRQLSVGVDDRTNTLILGCSEAVYQDVRNLVHQLDEAARDTPPEGKSGTKKGGGN